MGTPITSAGMFSVPDPEVFRRFVSLAAGAAALGGMSAATGEAVERLTSWLTGGPPRPPGMPHDVLVVVTNAAVVLFAHSRHATADSQADCFNAGQFKAHASWYPFTIDLSITPDDRARLVLSGKRGPRRGVARTVRAVLGLASASDRPGSYEPHAAP